MMQKDEGELLETWVRYHADIVGGASLYVIDNGSEDSRTLEALARCEALGVNVRFRPDPRDFESKGQIVAAMMSELAPRFDWFLPFDCDEFLIALSGEAVSADASHIQEELRQAQASGKPLIRIERALYHVPHTTRFTPGRINRAAIKSGFEAKLSQGFHFYQTGRYAIADNQCVSTSLAFIHFHARPYRDMVVRSRLKLRQRVPDFSKTTLQDYDGKGGHLRSVFLRDEKDFKSRLRSRARSGRDCSALFAAKGLTVPFSRPHEPLSSAETARLLDPINLFHEARSIRAELDEVELWYEHVRSARSYLEFGTGGTTAVACKAGVPRIVSVDASLDAIEHLVKTSELQRFVEGKTLELKHSCMVRPDGDPDREGDPGIDWRDDYVSAARRPEDFDVVFIDGLFRVCCGAAVYLHQGDPTVLVHDCQREGYRVLERLYERIGSAGTLSVFKKRPGASAEAEQLFRDFALDSR